MRLRFPHIPRIITATILPGVANFSLWAFLISLISLNAILLKTKPLARSDKLFTVFSQPFSALTHQSLALELWNSGARTRAKQELAIASELSSVLGATTNSSDLLHVWENAPIREAAQRTYWLGVIATHPDYRDAYIQLASLSYTQGNLTQTKAYLSEAAALDPNSKTVKGFLEFVEKILR